MQDSKDGFALMELMITDLLQLQEFNLEIFLPKLRLQNCEVYSYMDCLAN